MLTITNLHTYYGAIHALQGIDLTVNEKEIVCLIGSNGSGKSTLFNTISGIVKAKEGLVVFNGEDITNLESHKIVKKGVSLSPEGREVFPSLTVKENLRMGAFVVKDREAIEESYERVFRLFPRLKERVNQSAGTLSGGEQQMLSIGRAMMSKPKLLLLDEPSLGLAPNLVVQIFELILEINKLGVGILLIEQNANMALQISNRAYVLKTGRVSLEGNAKDISENEQVKKSYLGI